MFASLTSRVAALALIALFVSCGATKLAYLPQASGGEADARALVERVVHEQPSDHVPSRFELAVDYLELSRGVRTGGTGIGLGVGIGHGVGVGIGGSRSRSKTVTDRVYFDAITALEVFQDGDVYFVRIRHSAGDGELDIYTHSLQRAHELADALASLRP